MSESTFLANTTNTLVTNLIKQEVFKCYNREVAQFEERWRRSVSLLTQSIELYNTNNVPINKKTEEYNRITDCNKLETKIQSEILPINNNEGNVEVKNQSAKAIIKNQLNFFMVENNLKDVVELEPTVLKINVSETVKKNIKLINELKEKRSERQNQNNFNKLQDDIFLDKFIVNNLKSETNKAKNKNVENPCEKLNKELFHNTKQESKEGDMQPIKTIEKQRHVTFPTDIISRNKTKHRKKELITDNMPHNHKFNKKLYTNDNNNNTNQVAERDITDLEHKYFDKFKENRIKNINSLYRNKCFNNKIRKDIYENDVQITKNVLKEKHKKIGKDLYDSNTENNPALKHNFIKSSLENIHLKNGINFKDTNNQIYNRIQKDQLEQHNSFMENTVKEDTRNIKINHQLLNKIYEKNITSDSFKKGAEKETNNINSNKNNRINEEKPKNKPNNKKISKKNKIMKKKQKKELKFFSPYMKRLNTFSNKPKHSKLIKIIYDNYKEENLNKDETKKCQHTRNDLSPRQSITNNKIVGVPLQPLIQELENQIKTTGNPEIENFYKANHDKLGGLYFLVSSLTFRNENNISNLDLNSELSDQKLGKPVWLDPDPRPNGFGPLKPRPHATYRRTARTRVVPQEYVLFFGDPNLNIYAAETI